MSTNDEAKHGMKKIVTQYVAPVSAAIEGARNSRKSRRSWKEANKGQQIVDILSTMEVID